MFPGSWIRTCRVHLHNATGVFASPKSRSFDFSPVVLSSLAARASVPTGARENDRLSRLTAFRICLRDPKADALFQILISYSGSIGAFFFSEGRPERGNNGRIRRGRPGPVDKPRG